MKMVITNLLVASMSVSFFLLAVQAEPITAFFGYSFGTILALALIMGNMPQRKGEEDA